MPADTSVSRSARIHAPSSSIARAAGTNSVSSVFGSARSACRTSFSRLPVGGGRIRADELFRRRPEPGGPRPGRHERSAPIDVGALAGESPGVRPHDRLEHDARRELRPGGLAAGREAHLPRPPRQELLTQIRHAPDAHDEDVVHVALTRHDTPHGAARDLPVTDGPVDTGRHLGAMRQRHHERICDARNEPVLGPGTWRPREARCLTDGAPAALSCCSARRRRALRARRAPRSRGSARRPCARGNRSRRGGCRRRR